jgi:hypothetical protein
LQRTAGMTRRAPRGMAVAATLACAVALSACSTSHGLTLPGPDTRTPIRLSAKEREQLRHGMRIYLESVEGAMDGARRGRMATVARSAKRSGMSMLEDVSFAEALKLPPEFIILSIDTHQRFDALSEAAGQGLSKAAALEQLSGILANCTSCHASYRLAPR